MCDENDLIQGEKCLDGFFVIFCKYSKVTDLWHYNQTKATAKNNLHSQTNLLGQLQLHRPLSMLVCMMRSINVQKTTLRGGEEQRDTELGSSTQCPN